MTIDRAVIQRAMINAFQAQIEDPVPWTTPWVDASDRPDDVVLDGHFDLVRISEAIAKALEGPPVSAT